MEEQICLYPRSGIRPPNACETRRPFHWVSNHTNFTFRRETFVSFLFALCNINVVHKKHRLFALLCVITDSIQTFLEKKTTSHLKPILRLGGGSIGGWKQTSGRLLYFLLTREPPRSKYYSYVFFLWKKYFLWRVPQKKVPWENSLNKIYGLVRSVWYLFRNGKTFALI